jgi:uncharacterized membrane protein
MAQTGLTQALAVATTGIIILIFDTLVLGQVVDLFVYYAATWELHQPVFRELMDQIMLFGRWFYYLIYILGILFVVYPIIFIIKRHRYMDVEPVQDQNMYMQ